MVTVANLQKNDVNLAFVNDNVYTKYGQNLSINSQNMEQKPNSDVNQWANSVANLHTKK